MPLGRTSVGDTRSCDGNGRHGRQGKHPAIEFVAACIIYGIVDEDGNIRVWEVDTNRGMASEREGLVVSSRQHASVCRGKWGLFRETSVRGRSEKPR